MAKDQDENPHFLGGMMVLVATRAVYQVVSGSSSFVPTE